MKSMKSDVSIPCVNASRKLDRKKAKASARRYNRPKRRTLCGCDACEPDRTRFVRRFSTAAGWQPTSKKPRLMEATSIGGGETGGSLLDRCLAIVRRQIGSSRAGRSATELSMPWWGGPQFARAGTSVYPRDAGQGCSDGVAANDDPSTVAARDMLAIPSTSKSGKHNVCSWSKTPDANFGFSSTFFKAESSVDSGSQIVPDSTSTPAAQTKSKDAVVPERLQSSSSALVTWAEAVGYNVCNVEVPDGSRKGLRPICIDGSNVAFGHSKGRCFSSRGLEICVDYFVGRGHRVYAIVPQYRKCRAKSSDPAALGRLDRDGHVVFTPSRVVGNAIRTSYDDRYVVQCAMATGGVIVSSDNFRDLIKENPHWKQTITDRLLMFTWIGDMLFFPLDPAGRNGPTLEEFLKF